MVEFTGERVIPGQVDADLWSEHVARYAFALRYVTGKRALDAGCGAGYGAAELAHGASQVTGVDLSGEALEYARAHHRLDNLTFTAGSCLALPFGAASFDVVAAFEVIEHLENPERFIAESARVLKPGGLFIVSTPNKRYYAESRAAVGPNPFHQEEFDVDEFRKALAEAFPHVVLLLQNRVESFAFHPAKALSEADARVDGCGGEAEDAHFFVALCSRQQLSGARSFVYVPRTANMLREREHHITLLQASLRNSENQRRELLDLFRKQKDELEARNRWAEQLNAELSETRARVAELQNELAGEQTAATEVVAGYEAKVRELDAENRAKAEWAMETEARLSAELQSRCDELGECVRLLQASEALVEERTHWAQRVSREGAALEAKLNLVRASRWFQLGRRLGIGPAAL